MNDFTLGTIDNQNKKELTGMFCATCEVEFASQEKHKSHYKSDFHQFNLKRKILHLPPLAEDVFLTSYNG